jgi:hypothetical protein
VVSPLPSKFSPYSMSTSAEMPFEPAHRKSVSNWSIPAESVLLPPSGS